MKTKEPEVLLSRDSGADNNLGNCADDAGHAAACSSLDDPFDLARLRLSQDFESTLGIKKALLTVPVRKPNRQEFIRVHPDKAYRFDTALLEVKEDREVYLVSPELRADLPGEVTAKTLFTSINRQNVVFLWGVRLPATTVG